MVFIILHNWWIGPPILVMCTEEEEDIVAEDITFTCQDVEYCEDYEYRQELRSFHFKLAGSGSV